MSTHWETMPLIDRALSNGIRLITEPIAATKAVAIGFWFPLGSRDEIESNHGIIHFIEHMLFKGTTTLNSFEIARFFDRIGGYINAFTEREILCVHCVIPSKYVHESIEIIEKMLFRSIFLDAELEKERTVITSEILASQDDPEEMAFDLAFSYMYPGHGLSRPIAGLVDEILALRNDQIRDHYFSFFRHIAPIVTIAGNVDSDAIADQLEKIHDSSVLISPINTSVPPTWNAGRHFPVSPFTQSQIILSFPVTSLKTEVDWFSWSLINAIIGDTVSSRLFQSLREKKGLCYSTYSFFARNRDCALWLAYVATPPNKTYECVESLFQEISSIRTGLFSEDELRDARSHLIGELEISSVDMENRMKRLARQFFFDGILSEYGRSAEILQNIHVSDLEKTMQGSFIEKSESLILYVGRKQVRECKKKWR